MAYSDRIHESIRGRNLGFEFISSGTHGSTQGGRMMVGPDAYRGSHSSAETTSKNLRAFGLTAFGTTSTGTGSSAVYTLDPPVPGTGPKIIALTCGASDGPVYFKTGGPTILSTGGSTFQTIKFSTRGMIELYPISTAVWFTPSASAEGPVLQETT